MKQFWYMDELVKEGQKLVSKKGNNPFDFVDVIKEIKSPEEIIVTLRAIHLKKNKTKKEINLKCKNLSMTAKLLMEAFDFVETWPVEEILKTNPFGG